ncbi:hypothetical protein IFM89_027526 [Coptis chinensis]|uniref:Uncharacterized protein n=1 Tax=Coptis chinensis TaxID=261450 RepID=A0A835HQC3_9MAGN|nr:hypothetical protein IFM89_027526 [Coptis chinensis]
MSTIGNLCNRCDESNHSSNNCCWLSTPCCFRKCGRSRILKQSRQSHSLGQFFLTCRICRDFQWLEDARASSMVSLESLRCRKANCLGVRKVNTSKKENVNEGKKFVNCTECGSDFQWYKELLMNNIESASTSSSSPASSSSSSKIDEIKRDKKVKITFEIEDNGLAKEFQFHCKIR